MNQHTDDNCIEISEVKRMTDKETRKIIEKYANVNIPTELQNLERIKRDEVVRKIKEVDGVLTRQIARLTGIGQSVIVKA